MIQTTISNQYEIKFHKHIIKLCHSLMIPLHYNHKGPKIFKNYQRISLIFLYIRSKNSLIDFLEELKEAINWVNNNRHESAKLSFDMMRQPVDSVELFLNRVKFEYVDGDKLIDKVSGYFNILIKEGIVDTKIDSKFIDIFKL